MADAYSSAISKALELTSAGALFPFASPATPEDILRSRRGDLGRLDQAAFCWDMYRGEQLSWLSRLPGESALEFARRPHKQFLNVTRVIVDVLSQLYRRPAERRLDGDDELAGRVQQAWNENPFTQVMLACDRLTRLQGVCAVRVSYQKGRLVYWPWPAHRLAVVPDPEYPARPLAVAAFAANDAGGRRLAHVWTNDRVAVISGGRVVSDDEHGIGRIPFAFFHDRLPVDGFWVEGRGPAIAYANAEFNSKLTELAYTVSMQGFGVMEIVNPDPAQEIALGPGRAIAFQVAPGQPYGVSFKSPNAPIGDLIADLGFLLATLLKTQRIPESVLSVHVAPNVSGVSILAAQTPVLEDRLERAQLFQAGERELLECTAAVLREYEGLGGEVSLRVNFPEPVLEQSLRERMDVDEWKLRHGLTTPWEIMRRDDPDAYADIEEARETWLNNRRAQEDCGQDGAGESHQSNPNGSPM